MLKLRRKRKITEEEFDAAMRKLYGPRIVEHPDGSLDLYRYDGVWIASYGPSDTVARSILLGPQFAAMSVTINGNSQP